MPRNMCLTRTLRIVRFGSGLGFPQTCHGACASRDTRLARIHLNSYEADQFTRPPQAPYALPAVWTGSMQLLGRQPCFMGLDTHAYLSKARTWHTATLLIGSPRPRGDRTPSAATLPALIGSPRPRGDRPQVRQPYQEHGIGYPCVAVFLYGHPFAIGLLTRGQAPGAATLSGDPYFMGLDTHTVFRGLDTHAYSLLIGSPRPRGDRTPGAATLSALIGSPRPRAAEPQVRQPYQEITACR